MMVSNILINTYCLFSRKGGYRDFNSCIHLSFFIYYFRQTVGEVRRISLKAREGESSDIESLPDEILLQIFEFLDVLEICRLSLMNSRFNVLSADETLWRQLFSR